MSQENVEIVRRLWEEWERRNSEAVFALYDPAIVWSGDATHGALEGLGGVYHGHDGVRQFFREVLESFDNYQAHAETIEETGDRVLVGIRTSARGKGSGIAVEQHRWNVYELKDGLVVRVQIFETKAEALEAAGLSE
jgi:ketosteroid isomerase-like protein